ncbi:MAG TPA: glycoside hydrolase family 15 protein [Oleiagrimonas sp.]|nr:glycoside hydrolase family 15 protein [Oleiagrimonas sp.]
MSDTTANAQMPRYPLHVLREYALLADGERGALVGPRGDIVWLCAPRWDSDAVFAALIGGGGVYAITPSDSRFVWGGSYEDGSLIWCSRWVTEGGVIECREALAFPADDERVVLLRRVMAVDTTAHMDVQLDVRAAFGRQPVAGLKRENGAWTGQAGDLNMRWSGADKARPGSGKDAEHILAMDLKLATGRQHDFVLELSENPLPPAPPDPDQAWRETRQTWQSRVPEFPDSLTPRDTRHAYAVLRGLTSSGGGMVASATMSLPERAEQGRNYDYRYVWIRDQCLAGEAIAAAGAYPLLDDAVRFVSARLLEDGAELAPAYTIRGERVPDQQSLHLPGYPGGNDIRGNHVNAQFQLDAFGEALLLFAAAARHGHLDADGWRAVEAAVGAIAARWGETEAGIWELEDRNWSESRLICVAGLRAVSRAPDAPAARSGEWLALAETLLADTAQHSVHPSGRWQRAPDDERLDAALLLPAIRGALPAGDPRTTATVAAVCKELDQDHYVYRFRQQPGRLGDAEGSFLLCGFAAALATHQLGRTGEALRYFERNRAACGPPGLLSEEYDVTQRQLRGNLPQAFVHAMLFEASVRLAKPWEDLA